MSDFQTDFFVYQIKGFWIFLSKFHQDLSFRWGDIPLFVTVYDLGLKILSFSNPSKNAILSGKKRTLRFIFFKFFLIIMIRNLLSDEQKKRFENPTFIGLTWLSRMNTIWGNHLPISNGVTLLVHISHMGHTGLNKASNAKVQTKLGCCLYVCL